MTLVLRLAHYIIPRHSNNHRAKLLHSSSLFLLTLFVIGSQLLLNFVPQTGIRILGYAANISPQEVVNQTNNKRRENGLGELALSSTLSDAARRKGEHMLANEYWAHVAPDGTEPWKFFRDVGYDYRYAGENLARDFTNPTSAVDAWMASPSHKENMLSPKYREIGVAVVEGDLGGVDTTIVVQLFGTKLTSVGSVPTEVAKPVSNVAQEPEVLPTLVPTIGVIQPTSFPSRGSIAPYTSEVTSGEIRVSPFSFTKAISAGILIMLLAVLTIDNIIVRRKNIPRSGGRIFAHLSFLGIILIIIIISTSGKVL